MEKILLKNRHLLILVHKELVQPQTINVHRTIYFSFFAQSGGRHWHYIYRLSLVICCFYIVLIHFVSYKWARTKFSNSPSIFDQQRPRITDILEILRLYIKGTSLNYHMLKYRGFENQE